MPPYLDYKFIALLIVYLPAFKYHERRLDLFLHGVWRSVGLTFIYSDEAINGLPLISNNQLFGGDYSFTGRTVLTAALGHSG